jgi:hypothetical protein
MNHGNKDTGSRETKLCINESLKQRYDNHNSRRRIAARSQNANNSCEKESIMEKEMKVMERGLTVIQRVAICFAAGVIGALAVVIFSHLLFGLGLSERLGVKAPVSLKSPDIYRPLFWGGLWGIPFGLLIKAAWTRLYPFGLLYFLAPVLALFLIFLPMSGAGYFGLQKGGPMFTLYLLVVNVPFGIVTALAARSIIGNKP